MGIKFRKHLPCFSYTNRRTALHLFAEYNDLKLFQQQNNSSLKTKTHITLSVTRTPADFLTAPEKNNSHYALFVCLSKVSMNIRDLYVQNMYMHECWLGVCKCSLHKPIIAFPSLILAAGLFLPSHVATVSIEYEPTLIHT